MIRRWSRFILLSSSLIVLSACGGSRKTASQRGTPGFEHELLEKSGKEDFPEEPAERHRTEELSGKLDNFIAEWKGTPHRMGGMSKKGVDCSGFVIVAYREVFDQPFRGRRAEDLFQEMEPLSRRELQYGDLVFFKIRGRKIDHVGIYIGNDRFAHASSSRGVMISSLKLDYFKKRFFKGGRVKS